ncbi:hypothetical protein PTSG_04186 [Salpingoeca rosetta]|uniref:vitamin-K-epoxide reductase (warfarin-sensitive) n=1 Tax=Salpingoeca rosetta (strain ATCC 50818 / BSB-021) TaxID=946362 RepID=F2U6U7_SALR5|nr:uncharacterized protein PTSG_04186 [Salpingoeca rosetta]EGD83579.1 hypothetical protein PTSG_04186 [Salpingoeca rosetta]|eukprot:XP_004995083.1 hypothetical protein PTSG_04186 [Salpingoeca rosetta]
MSLLVILTALAGVGVCAFALYVEHEATTHEDYKAPCDISEHMSCTRVFTSQWGRGYGIIAPLLGEDSPLNMPNPYYGILFYVALLVKELVLPRSRVLDLMCFAATLVAVGMCAYLAYILAFVLEDFCAVCVSSYVINAALLFLLWPSSSPASPSTKKNKKRD